MIEHNEDGRYGIGEVQYPGDTYMATAPDGVQISAYRLGPDYGVPVLVIGGQPSSMQEVFVTQSELDELSVRLTSFDRRGYGKSGYVPDGYVEDVVGDASAVMADVQRFGIVARSGGVRSALVIAAVLQERISGMVLLGGTAPPELGLDPLKDVTEKNRTLLTDAATNPELAERDIRELARKITKNPAFLYDEELSPSFRGSDHLPQVVCGLREQIIRGHATAIGDGSGWLNDLLTGQKQWTRQGPPDLSRITAPTVLVHGSEDSFVSPENSKVLAAHIPNATLYIQDGSHMNLPLYTYQALEVVRDFHLGNLASLAASLAMQRWNEELRNFENLPPTDLSYLEQGRSSEEIHRTIMERILTPESFYNNVIRQMLQERTGVMHSESDLPLS